MLELDWVVGVRLQELGQLHSCGRGAQLHFAPLAGCLCLKQFLTNARVSLMQEYTHRGGSASPSEQPCTSSVTLNQNEKGDGRSYFYFLLGAKEKKGGTLYHVILKKKKNQIPLRFLLVYFLFYFCCLPVFLTNVSLPPGIREYVVQSAS